MNAESVPARQKKILVVDDNEVILKTISLNCKTLVFKSLPPWTVPRRSPPRARKLPI
jgi:hypothetical protein